MILAANYKFNNWHIYQNSNSDLYRDSGEISFRVS